MNHLALPLVLVLIASAFQGSFGLGMKYVKPLSWEAWWLVYSLVGMLVIPLAWAVIAVPNLHDAIAAAPPDSIRQGVLFGFLWGIGGILFGVSIRLVGVSITYGIVMGLAASMGSLIPLFRMGASGAGGALPFILGGIALMLVGVAVCGAACVKRDRLAAAGQPASLGTGLAVAAACGILSALLNVGFAAAAPVAASAAAHGALTRNSSLAAWVVVLSGATLMNAAYAFWLLIRNRSWRSFAAPGAGAAYGWALLTGVLWFGALGIYGQGAALMGAIGPVIGWPMLLGLSLIVSNAWAWKIGEWRNAAAPFRVMLAGVAILIAACAILGYAHRLP